MHKGRTLAVALVAIAATLAALAGQAPAASGHAILSEVYCDTYVTGESDEFVRLHNPTATAIALAGWTITDGEGTLTFPAGATLAAGASAYVTGRATSFRLDMVVSPQWEYLSDSDATIPNLARTGSFSLANSGDEVQLKDASAAVVDVVVYGASTFAGAGWSGAAIPAAGEGKIMERDREEGMPDTDSAADWNDARVYVAGQSHFALDSFAFTGNVVAFTSPDSSYAEITRAIGEATTSIDLNIYEITNAHLGDALLARAQAGVAMRVLVEGGPAGLAQADRYQENWILDRLADAGADVRFLITNATQGIHDRYNFDHAKYAILDGHRVLAMSGNWKSSGVPVDSSTGNREWGIIVDHAPLAAYMKIVYDDDFSNAHRDILPFGAGTDWRYHPPPASFTPSYAVPTGTYESPYPALRTTATATVTPILTPDTDLLETGSLLSRLRGAEERILIEQMYAHKHWGTAGDTPETAPNLLLEAALTAARERGAHVYLLLGDEFIDEEDTRNNYETRDYVNGIRLAEGIPVYAKIVDHRIANLTKIHNKGVVIDGNAALVSSINWGEASATLNREVALLVDDAEIAQFYESVFWYDWSPRHRVPPSDLAVLDVRFEPDAPAGAAAGRVVVTVANVGKYATSSAFNVTANATPSWLGGTIALGALNVPALAPGANVTLAFPMDTLLRAGTWTFAALADPEGRVLELAEDNNALARNGAIHVDAPGVDARGFAASPSAPALPPPGMPEAPALPAP